MPAWLTPGEFVVNKEATDMFGPQIEAMNNEGRKVQQMNKGGAVDISPVQFSGAASYAQFGGLQPSYGSDYQYVAPEDNTSLWYDQESIDNIERAIPKPIKDALAVLNAIESGEVEAKKSWSFNEGGDVPAAPISYPQALLESREGFRDDVYLDTLGNPTVGHGHLLPDEYKQEVGKSPFTESQLDEFFQMDIDTATKAARKNIKNFDKLNKQQQGALISQAFQLGKTGQAKFKNMIEAIESGNHEAVGQHALDSLWAEQTPKRADDIVQAFMKGGEVQYHNLGDYIKGLIGQGGDEDIYADDSTSIVPPPPENNIFSAPTLPVEKPAQISGDAFSEGQPTEPVKPVETNPGLKAIVDAFTPQSL